VVPTSHVEWILVRLVFLSFFVLVELVRQCRHIFVVDIPISTHYQVISGGSTPTHIIIVVVVVVIVIASQGNNIFDESSSA
jgi:hypothetical protein